MQKWCTILSTTHLLLISLTTVVAAFVIESIIGTGPACMLVALVALISSAFARRYWLTATSLCTLAVGIFFIVYELMFWGFGGPEKAALPLCVLFLVAQAFAIFGTVADLNQRLHSAGLAINQISIKQMLVASALFAISFSIMEYFPTELVPSISDWSVAFQHSWLVSLAFAMFFLTVCGFVSIWMASRSACAQTAE